MNKMKIKSNYQVNFYSHICVILQAYFEKKITSKTANHYVLKIGSK